MNRIRRFPKEQGFTSGEKALAVMIIAGVCGFWAGANLSTPSDVAGLSAAAAAMLPSTVLAKEVRPASPSTLRVRPQIVTPAPTGLVTREDPPIPAF